MDHPETNSLPLKIGYAKRKLRFQPYIFRCKKVSFREGKYTKSPLTWGSGIRSWINLSNSTCGNKTLKKIAVLGSPSRAPKWKCLEVRIYIMGVSLNGGTPISHPTMIIFSRKTNGCWVPPFLETPIFNNSRELSAYEIHLRVKQ